MIIEDDQDFAYLICKKLSIAEDMIIAGTYGEVSDDIITDAAQHADVVLLDLNLSGNLEEDEFDGVRIAKKIRGQTDAKILILTAYESPGIVMRSSMDAFASGYLYKSNHVMLLSAIRDVFYERNPEGIYICASLLKKLTFAERYTLMNYLGYDVEIHSTAKTKSNQISSIVQKLGVEKPSDLFHVFKNYPNLMSLNID